MSLIGTASHLFSVLVSTIVIGGRRARDSPLMEAVSKYLNSALDAAGVPEEDLPSIASLSYTVLIVVVSMIVYTIHWKRRRQLISQLAEAEARLRYLNEKLLSPDSSSSKEVRVFMDGAFDLLHYGHMNAFRLARSLGTHLIVGINSDESITACKGAPLMNDEERLAMVSACKFVDEVVPNCPYVMSKEYLDYVIEKYNIDYVVHGDDPCIVDGKDVYAEAKRSGKFRTIPRTDGVSTTDIVGRMLIMTKEHHLHRTMSDVSISSGSGSNRLETIERLGLQSKFLTTSRMLQLFSANVQAPRKGMHVVYIDGAWDMFHPGHVAVLKAARERGDYLIVGIHGDSVVNSVKGINLPLLNLHERVLSVLGCRYVNDVLIDAPYEISEEMIETLNISEVVRGSVADNFGSSHDMEIRYRQAIKAGIFSTIEIANDFRISNVIQRIQRNQETFQAKFERKRHAEQLYYRGKQHQNTTSYV